jgi:hypothetical protein
MSAEQDIIDAIEATGAEVTTINHAGGKCERCGIESKELAFGGCFICGMWEDPESSDKDIRGGTETAFEYGWTLKMWLAGRQHWGKLLPPTQLVERIRIDIAAHIEVMKNKLKQWEQLNSE